MSTICKDSHYYLKSDTEECSEPYEYDYENALTAEEEVPFEHK